MVMPAFCEWGIDCTGGGSYGGYDPFQVYGGGGGMGAGGGGVIVGSGSGVISTIQQTIANTQRDPVVTPAPATCRCPSNIDAPCGCAHPDTTPIPTPYNTVVPPVISSFDLNGLFQRASSWIKENPIPSLAIGVGVGYLITKGGK